MLETYPRSEETVFTGKLWVHMGHQHHLCLVLVDLSL